MTEDAVLTGRLEEFVKGKGWESLVRLCVLNLKKHSTPFAGVNMTQFIYPASIYKLYVAGALLEMVARLDHSALEHVVTVTDTNAIDKVKEIPSDPRPLLVAGDKIMVKMLLDLMITRSDNSAANCLIDLIGRPRINEFMHRHGWVGSEVTRKFLPRSLEDQEYARPEVKRTVSSALHFAEFLHLLEQKKIGNNQTSMLLKSLLGRQLDGSKISRGLPQGVRFAHKTGWFEVTLKDGRKGGNSGDVGIVEGSGCHYIIACLTEVIVPEGNDMLTQIGARVHKLITEG